MSINTTRASIHITFTHTTVGMRLHFDSLSEAESAYARATLTQGTTWIEGHDGHGNLVAINTRHIERLRRPDTIPGDTP